MAEMQSWGSSETAAASPVVVGGGGGVADTQLLLLLPLLEREGDDDLDQAHGGGSYDGSRRPRILRKWGRRGWRSVTA